MSSLVGIVDHDLRQPEIRDILLAQLKRVRMPDSVAQEHIHCTDGIGLAHRDTGLFVNNDTNTESPNEPILLLDGEIHNLSELARKHLPATYHSNASPAHLCASMLLAHGLDFAVEFNGLFTIVLFEPAKQALSIVTDRYGFRSVYFTRRGTRFIFGSEIKALCAADSQERQLDPIGLAEQLFYGNPVMEKTWIADYERLPPAGILRVSRSGVEQQTYWHYRYAEDAPKLDQESYFTVYASRLARAVERCMSGDKRKGIFLSGGYDSRAIAATIHPSYLPLPAFTFGDAESRDVIFGRQLAQRLGFEHHVFHDQPKEPFLFRFCRQINWRSEGMLSFGHVTSIRHHDTFTRHFDIVLTGFLAEFNGSHTWPKLLLARSRAAAAEVMFEHHVGARLEQVRRVLQPRFADEALGAIRERFQRSIDSVDNDHPLNLADAWNLSYIQPRGTFLSPIVDRHRFEIRTPQMDTELLDFLLTIPPYARLEQRVYKKMIAFAYPAIRDVPCTNSAKPIDPRFALEYSKMVARYAARKAYAPIQRRLRLKPALGRDLADRNALFRQEPELVDELLMPMLDAGIFPTEVFNHDGIKTIVDQHYHHGGAHWELLSLLISWGLGASYFLYGDQTEPPGPQG